MREIGDATEAWIAACRAAGDPVPEPTAKGASGGVRILQGAAPLPESRIRLAWSDGAVWGDGAEAVLDLPPAKGGVLAFLTDPAAFNAVAVGPRDRTLAWRDPEVYEIDLRADTLWRPHHSATEAV